MITSFGSDGSDSEDENNSSDEKKISIPLSELGNSNSIPYLKVGEIGPAFHQTEMQSPTKNLSHSYKFDSINISNCTNQSEQSDKCKIIESSNKNNIAQGEKLSIGNKNRRDISTQNAVPKLDFKVSLVPGYGDDSDGEEEVKPKQEIKPLFPIVQDDEYIDVINSSKTSHGVSTKNSSNIQTCDQYNDNGDSQETKNDEKMQEKDSKIDEDKSKTNIFLEDMQMCGKAFQRKKRIAFDGTNYYNLFSTSK